MTPEAIEDLLRARGCSITAPRRAIVRFLAHNTAHPTASMVFEAVTREHPAASRATVYNTLALLSELGVVHPLRLGDAETHFDPNLGHHHHAVCPSCGRIDDVPAEEVQVRRMGRVDEGASVCFEARCVTCEAG